MVRVRVTLAAALSSLVILLVAVLLGVALAIAVTTLFVAPTAGGTVVGVGILIVVGAATAAAWRGLP